ncbi:hypothetical protein [Asanoa iriomotensis]|uniref:hypothetical protein n=1 Tax=Asanoa iriomotensis TaxID=234613 RepID=UPI001EF20B62|nr:hypothetical protein [Asanoa iriomotensis]
MSGADADEAGEPRPAERGVFEPSVKLPTKPAGGEHAGGGPEPLGEIVLGPLIGYGSPHTGNSHLGGIDNGNRLPVQRGGFQGSRLRPRHTAHLPE